MRVFHQLTEASSDLAPSAVAIGNFDGLHRGHLALLQAMLREAKHSGTVGTVLTFYPHPVEVLNPGKPLQRLTTASEKLALLEALGVEVVLVVAFDRTLASLSPEEFFERFLVKGLHARAVHVGSDFHFGQGRRGNPTVLESLCRAQGIGLTVQPPVTWASKRVSSSEIREQIRAGDLLRAAEELGRPYSISGPVVHGDQRGRQLGFSTANLRPPQEKILPRNGVYLTRTIWQKQAYLSVANVGLRPTFEPLATQAVVEVHLLDFSASLYDEFLQVDFFDRIRDEMKFDSVDALKARITADVAEARRLRAAGKGSLWDSLLTF